MLVLIFYLTIESMPRAQGLSFSDIKSSLESELKDDLSKASDWAGKQIGSFWGFYATGSGNSPGAPMDGLWHFEVGLSGGANLIYHPSSTPSSKHLPGGDLGPSLANPLLPGWLLYSRLSLFDGFDLKVTKIGGIDLGGKFAVLPRTDLGSGLEADTLIYGGELRIGIYQDTRTTPGFSLTTTYENVSGKMLIRKSYKLDQVKVSNAGNEITLTGDISGDVSLETTYSLHVIGTKLIASKKIFFLTPYLGMGTSINIGGLRVDGKNTTQLKNFTVSDQSVTPPAEETIEGSIQLKSISPNPYDVRLLGGLEANVFQFINIGLEWTTTYNFQNHFINLGVRGQF